MEKRTRENEKDNFFMRLRYISVNGKESSDIALMSVSMGDVSNGETKSKQGEIIIRD